MRQLENKSFEFDNLKKNLRLVVIEGPYLAWEQSQIPQLFHQMVLLKKKGYEECYTRSVLPVDTTDFVATHIMLCVQQPNGNLKPVMGFKTISLQKCDEYNLAFPALALTNQAHAKTHSHVIDRMMQSSRKSQNELAYLGSWTVDHDFKNKNNLQKALREIFMATYCFYFTEQKISHVIIGGTLRFGTEKLFAQLGHVPIALNRQQLPPICVAHLAGEPVLVMHADHIPDPLRFAANSWQLLWQDRLLIKPLVTSAGRKTA